MCISMPQEKRRFKIILTFSNDGNNIRKYIVFYCTEIICTLQCERPFNIVIISKGSFVCYDYCMPFAVFSIINSPVILVMQSLTYHYVGKDLTGLLGWGGFNRE